MALAIVLGWQPSELERMDDLEVEDWYDTARAVARVRRGRGA